LLNSSAKIFDLAIKDIEVVAITAELKGISFV
jgi:hypothetical protein